MGLEILDQNLDTQDPQDHLGWTLIHIGALSYVHQSNGEKSLFHIPDLFIFSC